MSRRRSITRNLGNPALVSSQKTQSLLPSEKNLTRKGRLLNSAPSKAECILCLMHAARPRFTKFNRAGLALFPSDFGRWLRTCPKIPYPCAPNQETLARCGQLPGLSISCRILSRRCSCEVDRRGMQCTVPVVPQLASTRADVKPTTG